MSERRYTRAGKPRVERRDDKSPATIQGYGAVFYRAGHPETEYELWQDNYERILPGAFDGQLDGDVRSLFNHDSNWVLGRTKSDPATLALAVDQTGLRYVVTPPDTQAVRDQVLEPIRRGDVDGSSFMFWPRRISWIQEDRDGREVWIRQLEKLDLLEVGPVTFPAYRGTTSGVRLADGDLATIRAERARETGRATAFDADAEAAAVEVALRRAQMLREMELFF